MDTLISSLGLADVAGEDSALVPRVVTGTIKAVNADGAAVDILDPAGQPVVAFLPVTEYYMGRTWTVGETLTLLPLTSGPRPVVSATRPELVEALLGGVSPEVRDGQVRVMKVARRAGLRTKVAVAAVEREGEQQVDPIAACVGRTHNRVDYLKRALGGEQVDIVAWHPDQATFLGNALQPAAVTEVILDPETRSAVAKAPGHQMSAAVGGGGLNSALAGYLVGVQVRIEEVS